MQRSEIRIRRTKFTDLLDAFKLVIGTANHLRKRSGMDSLHFRIDGPYPLMVHLLKTDPEGSFVAVNNQNVIIGFTMSQMRDGEWYLAYLFVNPAYQSTGIGQKLLAKAMKYGTDCGCSRRALATFSYNPNAVALYSKYGMSPQRPIVAMIKSDQSSNMRSLKPSSKRLSAEVIKDHRYVNRLTSFDHRARGIARPEEHFFWSGQISRDVLVFHEGTRLAGYSVVSQTGSIGPIAAARAEYLQTIMIMSLEHSLINDYSKQFIFL